MVWREERTAGEGVENYFTDSFTVFLSLTACASLVMIRENVVIMTAGSILTL